MRKLLALLLFVALPALAQQQINLTSQVKGLLPVANGGIGIGTLTGLALGNGTSAFSAYTGTSCTNQFPRSLSAAGAATCATVANTDLANSSMTIAGHSVALGGTQTIACGDLSNGTALCSTSPGTGIATALGVNVGTAGAPVVNGGALGTPSSGTVTNLTGTASININGTVGATTATTGAFTTVTATSIALGGGTALANYAEGTWTPTLNSFTIVNGTGAISTAGYYTRIGRIVHFTVEITGTGTATIASVAGTSYITGLPINNVRGGVATVQNVSMTFTSTGCNVPANDSEIQTPAWSAFTPAVNGVISINGWYEAS